MSHEQRWELVVEIKKVEVDVPDSIKRMIEKQVDHLDAEEQRTLEVASVAGAEFTTLAVVAGLGEDRTAVEARARSTRSSTSLYSRLRCSRTTEWRDSERDTASSTLCIRTSCMSECQHPDASNCTDGYENEERKSMATTPGELLETLAMHLEARETTTGRSSILNRLQTMLLLAWLITKP